MKNLTRFPMLALIMTAMSLTTCQKDLEEPTSPLVFAAKYTYLTLNDQFDLPNPAASEQYALQLFDLKDDGDGLTERELLSVGNPSQDEDLVYALLFVESFNRDEILWSWLETQLDDDDPDDRSAYGKWKWTGGDPLASMYCSGFKKWPAYKVKNRFTDPCGEVLIGGPVYQCCFNLCDDNLPVGCDVNVNKLPINQLQIIGSHNSYRKRTDPAILGFMYQSLQLLPPEFNPDFWDYEHLPLDEQFNEYGVRCIELDVFDDPNGGLFAFRYGKAIVTGNPAEGVANIPDLMTPGLKMLHYPDLDYNTNDYYTFKKGLMAVKDWSDAHPTHLPMIIMVEPKNDDPYNELAGIAQLLNAPNLFTNTIPFTAANLSTIENEIWDIFGEEQVITPDEVRGNLPSLNFAITHNKWPRLEEARGKILFVMLPSNNEKEAYLSLYPELHGATMFVFSDPGNPETAFVRMEDPISHFAQIQNLVNEGYFVRTRADAETLEARYPGSVTRRDKAFASGAQIISTDYYRADPRFIMGPSSGWSDYSVFFESGELFRVNPVSGSPNAQGYVIRE
ncbi:MAG: Ca2+-dependent phosphoinositide-specific phospholipase C [Saprospiraceae bacterium]